MHTSIETIKQIFTTTSLPHKLKVATQTHTHTHTHCAHEVSRRDNPPRPKEKKKWIHSTQNACVCDAQHSTLRLSQLSPRGNQSIGCLNLAPSPNFVARCAIETAPPASEERDAFAVRVLLAYSLALLETPNSARRLVQVHLAIFCVTDMPLTHLDPVVNRFWRTSSD